MSESSSTFLIKDATLVDFTAYFFTWLKKNGFKLWDKAPGHFGMDCVYVNIYSKLYCYGMPGIKMTDYCGDVPISINDFITIYEIFEKKKEPQQIQITRGKDIEV